MDYKIIGLVAVLCVAIYFSVKPVSAFIKSKIGDFDLKKMLEDLEGIALLLGDDKIDMFTIPIFAILIDTINYAEKVEEDGIIDFDDLLEYVMNQLELFEIYITDDEEYLIDMACDFIASYIFNKR